MKKAGPTVRRSQASVPRVFDSACSAFIGLGVTAGVDGGHEGFILIRFVPALEGGHPAVPDPETADRRLSTERERIRRSHIKPNSLEPRCAFHARSSRASRRSEIMRLPSLGCAGGDGVIAGSRAGSIAEVHGPDLFVLTVGHGRIDRQHRGRRARRTQLLLDGAELAPIPVEEDVISLSAILLNDDPRFSNWARG